MLIVVTGGAASGKSEFAENLLANCSNKYYLATMHIDNHEETRYRISRHQKLREGKGFVTLEQECNLLEILPDITRCDSRPNVLLECMSNLLSNEMFGSSKTQNPVKKIVDEVITLSQYCDKCIVITSEIGCDGETYEEFSMRYLTNLARINQQLVAHAKEAYEVVYSIPLRIK